MQICFISPYHFFAYKGGQEQYAHQLALALTARSHQVTYLTGPAKANQLPYALARRPLHHVLGQPAPPPSWLTAVNLISPDVIHVFGFNPLITAYLGYLRLSHTTPLVISLLAPTGHPHRLVRSLSSLLTTGGLNTYQAITTLTPQATLRLKRSTRRPVFTLSPSLPGKFLDTPIKPLSPQAASPTRLLFVGALDQHHYYKGLSVLLHALSLSKKSVRLTIVGHGNRLGHFQTLTDKLKISHQVRFLGSVPSARLIKLYQTSHGLILPSTSSSEGFGIVVLEALACGTPVITTTKAGIAPILEDQPFALIIPPRDPAALFHAINRLPQKTAISAQAATFARAFTPQRSAHTALNIYRSVLK